MNRKIEFVVSSVEYLSFLDKLEEMISTEAGKNNMVFQLREDLSRQIIDRDAILAICENELVGYICLEHWKYYIEVGALVVSEEYRRRGIGQNLFAKVIKLWQVKDNNKELIVLSNKISGHIAEKLGFVEKTKDYFKEEIWLLCKQCKDYDNFPNCRCLTAVYPRFSSIQFNSTGHK